MDDQTFDLQLFAEADEPEPEPEIDDEEIKDYEDEDDPDTLKEKLKKFEKENKTWDKRYRDIQSLSQKTKNRIDALEHELEANGLEYRDGKLVKKQLEVGEKKLSKPELAALAEKDAYGAIEKIAEQKAREIIENMNRQNEHKSLLDRQKEDKALVESLDGYEVVRDEVEDIIRKDKGLVATANPFSYALLRLGDPDLTATLRERANFGVKDKTNYKRKAAVASGGSSTSGDLGIPREKLANMPIDKLEKLVEQETIKQTGKKAISHYE